MNVSRATGGGNDDPDFVDGIYGSDLVERVHTLFVFGLFATTAYKF